MVSNAPTDITADAKIKRTELSRSFVSIAIVSSASDLKKQ
jgi:hypothetical protein